MANTKAEIYTDKNHAHINDDVDYIHLTHVPTLNNAHYADINLGDCLDYALERDNILMAVITKLRYNGELHIEGVDLEDAVISASSGSLNVQQLQALLYAGKLSTDTYENVIQKLQSANLHITHSVRSENKYYITAKRELPSEN